MNVPTTLCKLLPPFTGGQGHALQDSTQQTPKARSVCAFLRWNLDYIEINVIQYNEHCAETRPAVDMASAWMIQLLGTSIQPNNIILRIQIRDKTLHLQHWICIDSDSGIHFPFHCAHTTAKCRWPTHQRSIGNIFEATRRDLHIISDMWQVW